MVKGSRNLVEFGSERMQSLAGQSAVMELLIILGVLAMVSLLAAGVALIHAKRREGTIRVLARVPDRYRRRP